MKSAKYSLVALMAVGVVSSLCAADTLADAFKNGKVGGELRAWYFDRDNGTTSHQDIFNTAVILNYVTDTFYGFRLGATMQSNYAPYADSDSKDLFKGDMYGSGAMLSEAYIGYAIGKTDLKIGRQFISTPLVSGSGSRIVKEAFQGAVLTNTDLPSTTLIAAYVNKFQGRTSTLADASDVGDIGDFTKTYALSVGKGGSVSKAFIDDAYSAGVINKSITGLTLTAQYALANDVAHLGDVSLYHAEANYVLPLNGFKLGFDAMYRTSRTDSALDNLNLEGSYFGGRVSIIDLAGFGISVAAATSDKSDDLIAGVGNGADSTYTGSILTSAHTYARDTDSYMGKISYDFSKIGVTGLSAFVLYADNDQGYTQGVAQTSGDWKNTACDVTYAFEGALKGFSLSLQYEKEDNDKRNAAGVNTNVTSEEYRFRANYKF
ncbi:OprD family outer membrane porin [Sulfurospirillum sp. hDNRA2]|uniref:OprD family outer membrane porin n=1 Tax=Sulfurospirillum sp. hDNRA2 TaxID=3237298 RepID=UPI0020B82F56|nr:OprD family outer membrane porin [Sulfurospirillum sp. DNRA8]MCP3651406.1 OprD family porin [Sulfurospirillum sp. DNRA8]MCR1810253.1 OprD family porin [Sulfurospirillum sp. DNRA8]